MIITTSDLNRIQKELRQVAVAVRAVGTSRPKLYAMAKMASPVLRALHQKRPEIAAARKAIHLAVQKVMQVQVKAKPAAKALDELSDALNGFREIMRKGYVGSGEAFSSPPFTFVDRWGLTRSEFFRLTDVLRSAYGVLGEFGLRSLLGGARIVVDPTMLTGEKVWFVPRANNEFVVSPGLDNEKDVWLAVGDKVFDLVFGKQQRKAWGGEGKKAFVKALVGFLDGNTLEPDVYSRLEATLLNRVA